MKNESTSDHRAREMNFKRPCWLALFVSLGAMLAGYSVYYGMFPYGQAGQVEAVSTWQMLPETGSFLLMAAGVFGNMASLVWWFVAAIKLQRRGSRRQPTAALATPSGLGSVAASFVCSTGTCKPEMTIVAERADLHRGALT